MALTETPPIQVENLTRRFRSKTALDNVTLSVPRGKVFGLLGENGAGKTTLIRHLMGLLRAQQGTVRVLGHDPIKDPERALGRVGYLSEDRDLPKWMRIDELMRYTQGFYPSWDVKYADELLHTFDLNPSQKIKTLSMGQTAKTGLLVALAHRPELLILDEPSSGLDAVVRKHILDAILRTVAEEGRTVLFSSHLLDEVERVSDQIAIIHNGRVLLNEPLSRMKQLHRRLRFRFDTPPARPPAIVEALHWESAGHEWTFYCEGEGHEIRSHITAINGRLIDESEPTLEEIFLARVGARPPRDNGV